MSKIKQRDFLNLLFDPDARISVSNGAGNWNCIGLPIDKICQANVPLTFYKKNKGIIGRRKVKWHKIQLLSINPTKKKGARLHEHCTSMKTLLVESDDDRYSPEEMVERIKNSKIPYTALTFSGNRSVHILITLNQPFTCKDKYQEVHSWIVNQLNHYTDGIEFDSKTKSHMNLTRMPNIPAKHSGRKFDTKVIELSRRIDDTELAEWLKDLWKPVKKYKSEHKDNPEALRAWAKHQDVEKIADEFAPGHRNVVAFKLAGIFKALDYSLEQALDEITDLCGGDLHGHETAIYSAYGQ